MVSMRSALSTLEREPENIVELAALVGESEIIEHQSADAGLMPYNATTGVQYKGNNIMRLLSAECEHGYGDGGWAGYRQWLEAGRVVRKGERGTQCMTVVRVTDDKGHETTKPRGFRVFHFDQTVELDAAEDGAA